MEKSSFNWEQLIIDTFSKTIKIQTNETSFSKFYDSHSFDIFKIFEIENPTKDEIAIVKDLFLKLDDHPLNLKNIVIQMIQTIPYDEIEELTFYCICPVITGAIKKHRELKPYLDQTGIVNIPFDFTENDLVRAKGDYFIQSQYYPNRIFKRSWNGKIVKMECNVDHIDKSISLCHSDSMKMPISVGISVGIIAIIGGYFWFSK